MKHVQLKVNQERLLKVMRDSFSRPRNVITELAQNARRAGSDRVDFTWEPETATLTVRDNGSGIGDLETLLSVASSGWDPEVVDRESPFGLGFLTALYFSRHITVESCDQRLSAATDNLLSMAWLPIEDAVTEPGATLVLKGLDERVFGKNPPESVFASLFSGFPIEVTLNGTSIERPFHEDALDGAASDIGTIALWSADEDWAFYLQGLPIEVKSGCSASFKPSGVVHLDSRRFAARVPDRTALIESEATALITPTLQMATANYFRSEAERNGPKWLCDNYRTAKNLGVLDLFNAIDLLPAGALQLLQPSMMEVAENYGDDGTSFYGYVQRSDVGEWLLVTDRGARSFSFQDEVSGFRGATAEWQCGAAGDEDHPLHEYVRDFNFLVACEVMRTVLVKRSALHEDHWVFDLAEPLTDAFIDRVASSFSVTPAGESLTFEGRGGPVAIQPAEAIEFQYGDSEERRKADMFVRMDEEGFIVAMTEDADTERFCRLYDTYGEEFTGALVEDDLMADADDLEAIMQRAFTRDDSVILRRLLERTGRSLDLPVGTYTVVIGSGGEMDVSKAA